MRGSQRVGMSNKRTTVHPGEMELAKNPRHTFVCRGFFLCNREDSNRAAAHSAASKATVRLCLARGSQRLGMSTKKDVDHLVRGFFVASSTNPRQSRTVQDSNSSGGDRRLRRKQGAEAGAAF